MKVDFMIIGAQKCGTTTLFDILDSHPSIVGSRLKEPHFFCSSKNWKNDLPKYEKLFPMEPDVLYFEASTTYTFYPLKNLNIWDDIFEYNPQMKFIYLVRNPIERIVSGYMHLYSRGYTDLDIEQALVKERSLMAITKYYTQINPYIRKFGRDRVSIIDFDEFLHERSSVMTDLSRFLGIDFSKFRDYENVHANISVKGGKIHHKFDNPPSPLKLMKLMFPKLWTKLTYNAHREFLEKPSLSLSSKRRIIDQLESEIEGLQKLTNKDFGKWRL